MDDPDTSQRPNIIFILADQLRPDFLGYNGFKGIATPNLDRLAAESISFDQAISATPICVPARAALLTGLSSLRTGVMSNQNWLRPDRDAMGLTTWPQLLSEAGYHTVGVGKMHFTPWESLEGFDQRIIAEDKRWPLIRDDYQLFLEAQGYSKRFAMENSTYHEQFGAIVNDLSVECTTDRFVSRRAIEVIEQRDKGKPLAMMISYPSPHCPYDPPQSYLDQVDESKIPAPIGDPWTGSGKQAMREDFLQGMLAAWHQIDYREFPAEAKRRIRQHYAALVKQIDDEVGLILSALEQQGMLENSLILFTSDHGDFVGDRGLVGKKLFYENSIRVPLLVRLPGGRSAARSSDLVELHDITATVLAAAGLVVPSWMDSRPLPGLSLGGETRTHITGFLDGQAMVRSGPWKLTRYACGVQELFDLESDPQELNNLIDVPDHRERVVMLNDLLWADLFPSIAFGHKSLSYESKQGRYLEADFCSPGWQRTYPAPVV
ncbi:arylsulfatase [soil metagenome]